MYARRSFSLVSISAASILFSLAPFGGTAAQDVRHLCSEKYRAAKAAGTLNGETWQQFYSKCTAESKANPPTSAAAPPPATAPSAPVAAAPPPVNPLKKPATKPAAPAAPAAAPSTAVFPTAIAPAYANEKPGKARMKTCDDQYKANKATNANGGLKWIQKGGGYWSECNKRLK
ncbi:MAG: hypothetical protein ACRECP_05430 [Methylocella sp.]